MTSIIFGIIVYICTLAGQAIGGFLPKVYRIPYDASISTLFTVIFQPLLWAVVFLIYIDIRIRKEHIDVDILAQRTLGQPPQSQPAKESPKSDTDKDDVWA